MASERGQLLKLMQKLDINNLRNVRKEVKAKKKKKKMMQLVIFLKKETKATSETHPQNEDHQPVEEVETAVPHHGAVLDWRTHGLPSWQLPALVKYGGSSILINRCPCERHARVGFHSFACEVRHFCRPEVMFEAPACIGSTRLEFVTVGASCIEGIDWVLPVLMPCQLRQFNSN